MAGNVSDQRAEYLARHGIAPQRRNDCVEQATGDLRSLVDSNFSVLLRSRLALGSWEEVGRLLGQLIAKRCD